jgi:hypothetical protein
MARPAARHSDLFVGATVPADPGTGSRLRPSVGGRPGLFLDDEVALDRKDATAFGEIEQLDQIRIDVKLRAVLAEPTRDAETQPLAPVGQPERRVEPGRDEPVTASWAAIARSGHAPMLHARSRAHHDPTVPHPSVRVTGWRGDREPQSPPKSRVGKRVVPSGLASPLRCVLLRLQIGSERLANTSLGRHSCVGSTNLVRGQRPEAFDGGLQSRKHALSWAGGAGGLARPRARQAYCTRRIVLASDQCFSRP